MKSEVIIWVALMIWLVVAVATMRDTRTERDETSAAVSNEK